MKVIVINPFMTVGYSGPTVLSERLFGELAKTDAVVLVGTQKARNYEPPKNVGKAVLSVPSLETVLGQLIWAIKVSWWILRKTKRSDLVHVHGAYLYNLLPAVNLALLGRDYVVMPLAANADLKVDARSNRVAFLGRIRKFVIAKSLLGFALSDGIAAELQTLGLSPNRIRLVGNPVNGVYFQNQRRCDADPRASKKVLGFVGKLGERKGPHLVLHSMTELARMGWGNVEAVFIGPFENRSYEEFFSRTVDELGLRGRVEVTGYVPDVSTRLKEDVSVFVLPSSQEGMPGALAEAMASGLPVVVTDVGAMGKVVSESSAGVIINPRTDELAGFVDRVWRDADLWASYSAKASGYARRHYAPDVICEAYRSAVVSIRASQDIGEEAL